MNTNQRRKLIDESRSLRKLGYSLSQISSSVGLVKSTVWGYVKNIILSPQQKETIEKRRKVLFGSRPNLRKGKCLPGRIVLKPKSWSKDLIHIVAHFMFDGHVRSQEGSYYSSSLYQIKHLKDLVSKIFKIEPKYQFRADGIIKISFYYVEFAKYLIEKKAEIFSYLNNGASKEEKRILLQAFFDDEGNVYYKGATRRVRGYQKSSQTLFEIKNYLQQFSIEARIDSNTKAIEITGKDNLITFAKEINFSRGIFINPHRKNGIWKKKIEKEEILSQAIRSYK